MTIQMTHVKGKEKGNIRLYALSTCIWCMRTKRLLDALGVAYEYADVDLLADGDREQAMQEIETFNPSGSFPTMIINDDICIVGYKEDKIKEALDNGR